MEAKHVVRFESKIDRVNGPLHPTLGTRCHPWLGSKKPEGYGRFWLIDRIVFANRVALEMKLGRPLHAGMLALHHCDNPPCCNEEHLYEGTPKQNSADCVGRGRTNKPRGADHHWNRRPDLRILGEQNWNARFTEDEIRLIRQLHEDGFNCRELADFFGVSRPAIGYIVRREHWRHVA